MESGHLGIRLTSLVNQKDMKGYELIGRNQVHTFEIDSITQMN